MKIAEYREDHHTPYYEYSSDYTPDEFNGAVKDTLKDAEREPGVIYFVLDENGEEIEP